MGTIEGTEERSAMGQFGACHSCQKTVIFIVLVGKVMESCFQKFLKFVLPCSSPGECCPLCPLQLGLSCGLRHLLPLSAQARLHLGWLPWDSSSPGAAAEDLSWCQVPKGSPEKRQGAGAPAQTIINDSY